MIQVMIVDDSAVVREVLQSLLDGLPDIRVIGVAPDPIFARQKMQRQWPDVLVLDIEMPRMDGLAFLRQIMRERPTPTVICSSLTEQGAETTLQALAAGAVSIVSKPTGGVGGFLRAQIGPLAATIRAAAAANVQALRSAPEPLATPRRHADAILPPPETTAPLLRSTDRIVALGTSTGGTQALERLLPRLAADCPGLAIVQHMPAEFTRRFAERLNTLCRIEVKEAASGDRLLPGRALIAPGGRHLTIQRSGGQYLAEIVDGPPISRHRPSVDVLFRSVARAAGRNALGMIMTGMGDDGARGLKEMRDAGANTVGQDEASCVVYGMPKEAVRLGAVAHVAPLEQLDHWITQHGH